MAHELEIGVADEMRDMVLAAGVEIVDAEYVMAILQEPLTQMRAEKAGAASNKDALSLSVFHNVSSVSEQNA